MVWIYCASLFHLLVHECFQNQPYSVIFSWSHDLSVKMLQLLERRQYHISNLASLLPFVSHCLFLSLSVSSPGGLLYHILMFSSAVLPARYTYHIPCDQQVCFQSNPVLHMLSKTPPSASVRSACKVQ